MKKFLTLTAILILIIILVMTYFTYSKYGTLNMNKITSDNALWGDLTKGVVIPGLRIMNLEDNSPLKKVGLVSLNDGTGYGNQPLLKDDIITGISINYDKTNFGDILARERLSKYFITVNYPQELYSELNKLKTNKIMLGVVRKVKAGTGYSYRSDIAVFSVEKLEGDYLKATMVSNTKELSK